MDNCSIDWNEYVDKQSPHCPLCGERLKLVEYSSMRGVYNAHFAHCAKDHEADVYGKGGSLLDARRNAKEKTVDVTMK